MSDVLGEKALECMPTIIQGFVEKPAECKKGLDFDKLLYGLRRSFEKNDSKPVIACDRRFLFGTLLS